VKNVDVFYLAEEGIFMQAGTRTFILDKLDRSAGSFERILLFDNRGAGGIETVTAATGRLIENTKTMLPVLRLQSGHRLRVDRMPILADITDPPASTVSTFDVADTPLGQVADKNFRPRGNDERELTLPELIAQLDHPPQGATPDKMRSELHKRLITMLVLPMLPFLAVPFALGGSSIRPARSIPGHRTILAFSRAATRGACRSRTSSARGRSRSPRSRPACTATRSTRPRRWPSRRYVRRPRRSRRSASCCSTA